MGRQNRFAINLIVDPAASRSAKSGLPEQLGSGACAP
jgi:hypothetical protein